jgi:D-serine deaminase-like pyridoxal phosphate-dependent protein
MAGDIRAGPSHAAALAIPAALRSPGVPTPALVVDAAVLTANIEQMAARARSAGVDLWPHVKTHKSKEVARLQLAAGAAGLTAATLTEAEAMADIGAAHLLVAYPPVDRWRVERLLALSRRARVSTVVDNASTALAIDQACQRADCDLGLLWEVDSGTGRLGTEPGSATAAEVAAVVPRLTRARFSGVMTFAGHVYSAAAGQEVRRAAEGEILAVRVTAAALAALGIPCPVLSIGSSPTAHYLDEAARGLQCRPGVYAYNDRTQIALGVADQSSCALTVLSTVISRPAPDRVIFDAGSKALSSDQMRPSTAGYGAVLGKPAISIDRLYEEHAIAHLPRDLDLPIGSRVRIIPNHACTTANMHRTLLVLDQGSVAGEWATGSAGWS